MTDTYQPLVDALRALEVAAYFQGPDQLVVSRQSGAVMPSSGNSFWVTHQEGSWYVCTWRPTCYRFPSRADLAALCIEFVDFGESAQPRIPHRMVDKYHLIELSDEEVKSLFSS